MTPSDFIKQESEEITLRTGRYIPPYRMANLVKAAGKITDILMSATFCMSYAECQMVLDVVAGAIRVATGEEEK